MHVIGPRAARAWLARSAGQYARAGPARAGHARGAGQLFIYIAYVVKLLSSSAFQGYGYYRTTNAEMCVRIFLVTILLLNCMLMMLKFIQ